MIEMTILAWQARILLTVGLAWLGLGLWLGYDPLTVAWRAAAGAVVCMIVGGVLLRLGARVIHQIAVREIEAERQALIDAATGSQAGAS